ncbi:imm11 family protein [Flavobacterium yafengii]|uniref:imm11 family protein n=1 Tax=Flavobacterium yafengii TaxID=3041253 RepID=UPI0024A8A311|nr:DUF1629 domain-containing protein [Flavobacterium yafengii]MDI5898549.1 hypothetical protein [Flavobacterium yafengii]
MYYSIQHSMDTKIVGKFFQSETIAWNYGNIDNPKLLNNIYFQKVDFEPIVPIPILHKKAKITDLISNVNAGGNLHLIISKKLKNIIEKYRTKELQFFKTSITKENIEYDDYFAMNMYESNMEFVDFKKSNVNVKVRKKEGGTELIKIQINTLEEFLSTVDFHKEKMEIVTIDNIFLNNQVNKDFFMLKNRVNIIVSEKLKQEIEDAGCTGIEFQPIELSYNEWTAPGGAREKVYGKI